MTLVKTTEFAVSLTLETIHRHKGRWFGVRTTDEILDKEVRYLFSHFCESIQPNRSGVTSFAITGYSLIFKNTQEIIDFYQRFLFQSKCIWIELEHIKLMYDFAQNKEYTLYMFEYGALIGFEQEDLTMALKLKLGY